MNIAIIGAGMAGLTVAKNLASQGFSVDVFDKGRGVGGRTSSRRSGWGYFDHGCQYFSVTDRLFHDFLREYSQIISPWQGKFYLWADGKFSQNDDDKIKYIPHYSMSNLCKEIAKNLRINLSTRITDLTKQKTWTLMDENLQEYSNYDWVIISAPPAQTRDLLLKHTVISEEIKHIEMLPCYSLMLATSEALKYDIDGLQLQHPCLGWIALNHLKPFRHNSYTMTIQSNFSWAKDSLEFDAERHGNAARTLVSNILKTATADILGENLDNLVYESVHLWRYALPAKASEQKYYLDREEKIGVCGDWCLKGKLESAFLSGYFLASALTEIL